MPATYTFDIFFQPRRFRCYSGDWGGYWGKQGPEFLDRRLALYEVEQRMVVGANTYRAHAHMLASGIRRHRGLAQTGVGGAVALARQPVVEPGTDGRRSGGADFDLELIESRTLDGHTQELIYRPTLHNWLRACAV